jgi:hypothetical protein
MRLDWITQPHVQPFQCMSYFSLPHQQFQQRITDAKERSGNFEEYILLFALFPMMP